jgi:hypothetical protein
MRSAHLTAVNPQPPAGRTVMDACGLCKGSGNCPTCDGTGVWTNSECAYCNGTGRCPGCFGTGQE